MRVNNGNYVYETDQRVLFQAPTDSVGKIRIDGTQRDDTFTLDYRGGDVIPTGGLIVDGTTGDNTLKIAGANSDLDLTGTGNAVVSNCEALDLSEPGTNRVLLDAAAIRSLAPTTSTLHVTADEKDQLIFPNSGDWRMADPIIVGTRFIVTANNNVAGGNERVESDNPRPWHNFVRASDVNNNGSVTASDALAGINELARGTFSNDDGMLRDPLEMTSWPGVYYDQNADGKLSALDLLRVINEMARLRNIIDLDNELIVPVSGLIASPITPGIVEESIDLVATQSLTKKLFDSRSNLVVFTDGQLVVSESKDENTGSQTPAKAIDALLSDEVFLDLLSGTGDAGLLMAG
jgi:hypothetical protein